MRNDLARLTELRRLTILESPREPAYDRITRLLATSLHVPITIVNMLDENRDWFKSAVGLSQSESPVATSFCEALFKESDDLIVVEDTQKDLRFSANALVTGAPFIRFYASARLVVSGQLVGTLCAYGMQPKKLTASQIGDLRTLAQLVTELLEQRAPAWRLN